MTRLLALVLCLMPLAASAAEEPIPIEQEPRHKLVFANEHVRYFDVELEPGYESRYHWHRADGVFVNISSSPTIAQDLDKEPVRRGERAIGETYFIDYGVKPKAHRVTSTRSLSIRRVWFGPSATGLAAPQPPRISASTT